MRAIVYEEYGPPEVLQLREIDKPTPGDGEVRIKIAATTVTSGDARLRGSRFPPLFWLPARLMLGLTRPRIQVLGLGLAGEIESVGKDVTAFRPGDRVYGSAGMGFGAYAEYICLPEDAVLAAQPDSITPEEAAAVPFGGLAALHFLRRAEIQRGQKVLVFGASGSIGTFAVQLARHYGAEVTGVCSTANLELVRSLGASRVIDYTAEDFTRGDERYDVVFDTTGKSSFLRTRGVLKKRGVYLLVSTEASHLFGMLWTSLTSRKRVVGGVVQERTEDLLFLNELIEAGELRSVIDRSYPLERIPEAHRYADRGHKKGNIAIALDPTAGSRAA